MINRCSLFTYLLFTILFFFCIVFGLTIFYNFRHCSRILLATQEDKYTALIRSSAEEMSLALLNVEDLVRQNIRLFDGMNDPSLEKTTELLALTLESHPDLFGMEIIFSPEGRAARPEGAFSVVYGWREGEEIQTTSERDTEEDYKTAWFRRPYEEKVPSWSEPYYDPVPETLMLTYSVPKLNDAGEVTAVFTADISLEWVDKSLLSLPMGRTGEPFLISEKQEIIVSSHPEWMMSETLQSLAEKAKTPQDAEDFRHISKMIQDKPWGYFRYHRPDRDEYARLYFRTLRQTKWTIGCIIPEREVTELLHQIMRILLVVGVLGISLMGISSWWIARSVSKPLHALSNAAEELAHGMFETELPSSVGRNEIARLVHSFDLMRTDLKRYISDVTETARAKERIRSELNLARSIQYGMVSKNFEPPRRYGIEVYASMESALEVGGDLYDFEMLDDDHFYFCIGDVSGKGIPASLFMAVGKTLIKSTMLALRDPAQVLTRVNQELNRDNEQTLFITALCGVMNRKTGEIIYANAGHNPPILLVPGRPPIYPDMEPGFPLALTEGAQYWNQGMTLPPGGTLFLYTDGATDAENPDAEFYGSSRLLSEIGSLAADSVRGLVESILERIHAFARSAKQSDDITILAFSRENIAENAEKPSQKA